MAWAIREPSGILVGAFGFDNIVEGHVAEIGYWIGKAWRGQGIMTDVVRVTTRFAFDELKLERLVAFVFDDNEASGRVLEKNGFQCEGVLRKHHKKGDRLIDSRVYARLRN